MAPDMHTLNLPKAPKGAKPVRSKPYIGGVVFQSIAAAVMLNGFKGLEHLGITSFIEKQYGGHYQYLTNWGLMLAIATTVSGAISDMLPGIKVLKTIKRSFLLVALPLALTISTIYWGLLLAAPSLILPPKVRSTTQPGEPSSSDDAPELFRIPLWIDISLHLVPAVVLAIEFFVREKRYKAPMSTVGALIACGILSASYTVWVEHAASINGRFPYPFLPLDSLPTRVAIYIGSTFFAFGAFKVINGLHRK